jgi:hypothetical protein
MTPDALIGGASHEEVIAQMRDIVVMHTSEPFARFRALLEEEGLRPTFYAEMSETVDAYERDLSTRDNLQIDMENESEAAREAAQEGREWVAILQAKAEQAVARREPAASDVTRDFLLGAAELGSTIAVRTTMTALLARLNDASAVAPLRISPTTLNTWIARGHDILARTHAEHAKALLARVSRQLETQDLYASQDKLSAQLEELDATREVVELIHKVNMPSFEFELLKAAAGRRRARRAAAAASPADGATGSFP